MQEGRRRHPFSQLLIQKLVLAVSPLCGYCASNLALHSHTLSQVSSKSGEVLHRDLIRKEQTPVELNTNYFQQHGVSSEEFSALQKVNASVQSGDCMDFCATLADPPWLERCAWRTGACSACPECTRPKGDCEDYCKDLKHTSWAKKCAWRTQICSACAECSSSGTATLSKNNSHQPHTSTATLSKNKSHEPHSAVCGGWCETLAAVPWSQKCAFKSKLCKGCSQCNASRHIKEPMGGVNSSSYACLDPRFPHLHRSGAPYCYKDAIQASTGQGPCDAWCALEAVVSPTCGDQVQLCKEIRVSAFMKLGIGCCRQPGSLPGLLGKMPGPDVAIPLSARTMKECKEQCSEKATCRFIGFDHKVGGCTAYTKADMVNSSSSAALCTHASHTTCWQRNASDVKAVQPDVNSAASNVKRTAREDEAEMAEGLTGLPAIKQAKSSKAKSNGTDQETEMPFEMVGVGCCSLNGTMPSENLIHIANASTLHSCKEQCASLRQCRFVQFRLRQSPNLSSENDGCWYTKLPNITAWSQDEMDGVCPEPADVACWQNQAHLTANGSSRTIQQIDRLRDLDDIRIGVKKPMLQAEPWIDLGNLPTEKLNGDEIESLESIHATNIKAQVACHDTPACKFFCWNQKDNVTTYYSTRLVAFVNSNTPGANWSCYQKAEDPPPFGIPPPLDMPADMTLQKPLALGAPQQASADSPEQKIWRCNALGECSDEGSGQFKALSANYNCDGTTPHWGKIPNRTHFKVEKIDHRNTTHNLGPDPALFYATYRNKDCFGFPDDVHSASKYGIGECISGSKDSTLCFQCDHGQVRIGSFKSNPMLTKDGPVMKEEDVVLFPWRQALHAQFLHTDHCGSECHVIGDRSYRVAWHSQHAAWQCEREPDRGSSVNGQRRFFEDNREMLRLLVVAWWAAMSCSLFFIYFVFTRFFMERHPHDDVHDQHPKFVKFDS